MESLNAQITNQSTVVSSQVVGVFTIAVITVESWYIVKAIYEYCDHLHKLNHSIFLAS